jgi:hypothetical protein
VFFGELGWWKHVKLSGFIPFPFQIYTVQVELANRRLTLTAWQANNDTSSGTPIATNGVSLNVAGDFPRPEACVVFAGRADAGDVSDVLVLAPTIRVERLDRSHLLLEAPSNDVKFVQGIAPLHFSQAVDVPMLASAFSTTAVVTGDAVTFDGSSALVLATTAALLPDGVGVRGLTLCLTWQRTAPISTLDATIGAIGSAFAIRYDAVYDRLAVVVDGVVLKDERYNSAATELGTARHRLCASTSERGFTALYIDGRRVLTSSARTTWQSLHSDVFLAFGATADPTAHASGDTRGVVGVMERARVWARQLTDTEVALA